LRIVALAPGFAGRQIDLLGAQKAAGHGRWTGPWQMRRALVVRCTGAGGGREALDPSAGTGARPISSCPTARPWHSGRDLCPMPCLPTKDDVKSLRLPLCGWLASDPFLQKIAKGEALSRRAVVRKASIAHPVLCGSRGRLFNRGQL
jgi:hypothetical protein